MFDNKFLQCQRNLGQINSIVVPIKTKYGIFSGKMEGKCISHILSILKHNNNIINIFLKYDWKSIWYSSSGRCNSWNNYHQTWIFYVIFFLYNLYFVLTFFCSSCRNVLILQLTKYSTNNNAINIYCVSKKSCSFL